MNNAYQKTGTLSSASGATSIQKKKSVSIVSPLHQKNHKMEIYKQ
jgi:hypothetical protein